MQQPDTPFESFLEPDAHEPGERAKSERIEDFVAQLKEVADKLVTDGATRGDSKLLVSAMKELRHCFRVFAKYRGAADYAGADRPELEELIRPTGFFRNKTTSLIKLGQALVERFDGEVPRTLDELVTLPGFGRKTANVVLGNAFDIPGITVDTHFGRLVRRFGWTAEDDPVKVEHAVGALIPRKEWTMFSHRK